MPDRILGSPLLAAALTPFFRLAEVPLVGRLFGLLFGLANALAADAFSTLLGILGAGSALDYYLGRKVAHANKTYDAERARLGMWSKVSGFLLLCLVRLFELWLARNGLLVTRGLIATALGVGLFVVDLESIEGHRKKLGAKPIPGFTNLVRFLRSVEQRIFPLKTNEA